MKIGIYGGSFNPVHNGHVRALNEFIHALELDEAIVIPSYLPPHKKMPELWASFQDRVEMLRIAIGDKAVVSEIEKELFERTGEKSYTKNTLQELKKRRDADYYLLVGTDMFATLHQWYSAEWIFGNVTIAVMKRDGDSNAIEQFKAIFERDYSAKIVVINAPCIEVSSTEIRRLIEGGKDSELIDRRVLEYIKENNLYKKRKSRDELLKLIEKALPPKRLSHTLAVEEEAVYLASHLCPDFENELSRAALLHDITKPWSVDEHIAFAKGTLDENDLRSPQTLHAKTGAGYAKLMGESCYSLIESHTTGKENMSLLEMIIFLADYTEKTREHTACQNERRRLHDALNSANGYPEKLSALKDSLIRVLDSTVMHLSEKQQFIHPRTLSALEYYKREKEQNEKNERA